MKRANRLSLPRNKRLISFRFTALTTTAKPLKSLTTLTALILTLLISTGTGCSIQSPNLGNTASSKQTPPKMAVASAHPLATQAGIDILKKGGNAFDASIAIAASLAVVEPYGSGIGGGGFWLIYEAKTDRYVMIDAREKAPLAAHRDLYVKEGVVDRDLATNTALSAGIPGVIAAFDHLATHYGKLPLSDSLKPAMQQAKEGFVISPTYQKLANMRQKVLNRYPISRTTFLDNGQVPADQSLVQQEDLYRTLKAVAKSGSDAFYQGPIAEEMVRSVKEAGGIWTLEDLERYQVIERSPIISHYHNNKIISAAPPSSGGIALASLFQMLEPRDLSALSTPERIHLYTEVMRRAYFDRAKHLGDPDHHNVPTSMLISSEHAAEMMSSFSSTQATPNDQLGPLITEPKQGENTTHFSIIDQEGNRVSATLSINFPFGSGFVAGNTGVLLNNEMDDFSAQIKSPNGYGLVGTEANAIAPEKRPLSSMSPTIIEMPHGVAILGTPGGSRIITMVFLASLEAMAGQPPEAWVSLPRFHHQYLPNQIQYEPGAFNSTVMNHLEQQGHTLKPLNRSYGNMHAILWNTKQDTVTAASDPRGIGEAVVESLK